MGKQVAAQGGAHGAVQERAIGFKNPNNIIKSCPSITSWTALAFIAVND